MLALLANKPERILALLISQSITEVADRRLYIEHKNYCNSLKEEVKKQLNIIEFRADKKLKTHPLIHVKNRLQETLSKLKNRRTEIAEQWKVNYEGLSWWNKMKYESGPDLSGLDKNIKELETISNNFEKKHKKDVDKLHSKYPDLSFLSNTARVQRAVGDKI